MIKVKHAFGIILITLVMVLCLMQYSYAIGTSTGGCPGWTTFEGTCDWTNVSTITTSYSNFEGGPGSMITTLPTTGNPNPTPVIKGVLYNNSVSGQWLITCPVPPDPTNTSEYIISNPSSYIAGNRCLANIPELVTTVNYNTQAFWGEVIPAYGTDETPSVYDMAQGSITNEAYSGMTQNQGSSKYNVSNGYDSQSYIFEQVPAAQQHGLWTWTAYYANLSKTDLSHLEVDEEYDDLQLSLPALCQFTYDYKIHSFVARINNTNISIPQYNDSTKDNYINFSGYLFSPVKTVSSSSCSSQLEAGQECGGWIKVSTLGTADISGQTYNDVNLYLGSSSASNPSSDYQESVLAAYSDGMAEANVLNMNYTNATVFPYLLYNLTVPSSYTQVGAGHNYLNLSYSLYSVHNLMDPGNSLDQVALYQGSGYFANYNGSLDVYPYNVVSILNPYPNGLGTPTGNFLSEMTEKQAAAIQFGQSGSNKAAQQLGNYVYGKIYNPISIAASPNGYVYVLNYSADNCWLCISTTSNSYLFVLKFIPIGYSNLSNNQPDKVASQTSLKNWTNEWKSYFVNTTLESSQDLYVANVYQLSSSSSSWWSGTKDNCGSSCTLSKFIPLSLATDAGGDVFILGAHLSGSFGGSGNGGFAIDGLLSNGQKIANSAITQPSGFVPSDEFAASPGGEFVYAANGTGTQSSGQINIYSVPGNFAYVGNIPLSYSNASFNMDIAAYLANGGPYNDSQVANAYSSYYSSNKMNSQDYDTASYHRPLAIIDTKGIVYVIDDWSFTIDDAQSSILMLRAFAENGTEMPIDPQFINTLVANSSSTSANTQYIYNGITPSYGWKPYGWPLSASIGLPSSSNSVSYCVAYCSKNGSSNDLNTGYLPIGPSLGALSQQDENAGPSNALGISSDFNGTLYIISHSLNSDADLSSNGKPYTELLVLRPNLQNYTKLTFADNSTFNCYINISVTNDACIYDENTANALGGMYPPVLGVPSVFGYVESLGGGEEYLNTQDAFSALFPAGINSLAYNTAVNNEKTNGFSNSSAVNIQTFVNGTLSGPTPTNSLPPTYLSSKIKGYVINPYNVTYVLNQSWSVTDVEATNPYFQTLCEGLAAGLFHGADYVADQPGTSNVTTTKYTYITTQLTSSSALNQTIEGGNIYPEYLPQQTSYIQNLSDGALIISPYINYELFTNRLLGEIYINQTINPAAAAQKPSSRSGLPVVINATQNFKYLSVNSVQEAGKYGTFPAYYTQQAVPDTSTSGNTATNSIIGANCGSSCPTPYYYKNQYYTGTNHLNFSNLTLTQFFPLSELLERTSYLDNLVLNISKNTNELGYNRLIYTYVDRFNNTIYQPVDVDFANITQITMNNTVQVSSSNTNQSNITINGKAAYETLNGTYPLPSGSPIYLYYDGNLGYYNITSSPTTNQQKYYTWAINCGFNPTTKNCQLANPLSTLTQKQPNGAQEANAVSYHTNSGSGGNTISTTSGTSCATQPTSLLSLPKYNCNLFGQFNLSSVQSGSNGQYQYCVPQFPNGTGYFNSQLGLIAIVKTGTNGTFNDSFNTCGVGQNRVTAYYYGSPGPEPIIVNQTALLYSGSANEMKPNANVLMNTTEYNYSYAPGQATTQFEIGSYALSFGAVGIVELLVTIAIVIAIAFGGVNIFKKGKKEKASK